MQHQPLYVFRGYIRNLNEAEQIWSDTAYLRRRFDPATVDENQVQQTRDEEFVVVSPTAFAKDAKFPIKFLKAQGRVRLLYAKYDDQSPDYTVHYDPEHDTTVLQKADAGTEYRPHIHFGEIVESAYADSTPQKQFQAQGTEPKAGAPQNFTQEELWSSLQADRVFVGREILAIDWLRRLPPATLKQQIGLIGPQEPMLLSVLDLTRHSDQELSYKAKALIKSISASEVLRDMVLSRDAQTQAAAARALLRIDRALSQAALAGISPPSLGPVRTAKTLLESGKPPRLLSATSSSAGDKFWITARWNKNDAKVTECLTDLFHQQLEAANTRSLADERALMRSGRRVAYWYEKAWVLLMADKIEKCGGASTFSPP
jgi:hypothetical protein